MPLLATVGDAFSAPNCYALQTVNLASLPFATALDFSNAIVLTSLNLNSLGETYNLNIISCAALTSLQLPAYSVPVFTITGSGSVALTDLYFNGQSLSVGANLEFIDCDLSQDSVDLIMAAGVAGGEPFGSIDVSGGTNSPPSATGVADAATLSTAGWTVFYNP